MLFNTFGSKEKSVIIMLAGSFCPAESLEVLYTELESDYYIIAPTYNGCYENSKSFTSRQGEAAEICAYIKENGICSVKMVYGMSMGCEVGLELIHQLVEHNIIVEHAFFDGAPLASLSKPMRKIMFVVFRKFVNSLRGKTLEETMNIGLVKMMSNKEPEALKPMIEAILTISDFLSDETIKNQVECCYTFDFPHFTDSMVKHFHFFYGQSEKAYKLSYKGTKKRYLQANYIIQKGYGHCTYLAKNKKAYIDLLCEIMN